MRTRAKHGELRQLQRRKTRVRMLRFVERRRS
jgi:hypothetical protein